ncbi:hypothetical protein BC629DRAFT_1524855 [Irpex lacteus]|nr:hypothetical protein BC629DRAFT_1524855 [Irpex lacteus]
MVNTLLSCPRRVVRTLSSFSFSVPAWALRYFVSSMSRVKKLVPDMIPKDVKKRPRLFEFNIKFSRAHTKMIKRKLNRLRREDAKHDRRMAKTQTQTARLRRNVVWIEMMTQVIRDAEVAAALMTSKPTEVIIRNKIRCSLITHNYDFTA